MQGAHWAQKEDVQTVRAQRWPLLGQHPGREATGSCPLWPQRTLAVYPLVLQTSPSLKNTYVVRTFGQQVFCLIYYPVFPKHVETEWEKNHMSSVAREVS